MIMKGLRFIYSMSILLWLFTLETNGQKAKPVHRIRGEVNFLSQSGVNDRMGEYDTYDIFLYDKDGIHETLYLRTEKQDTFNIVINTELLNRYSHLIFHVNAKKIENINFWRKQLSCKPTMYEIPSRSNTIIKVNISCYDQPVLYKKPVLYIYPLQETIIHIKHHYRGKHTFTYPLYEDGWKVLAKPNGDLMNLKDSTQHRYLFWEGISDMSKQELKNTEGFIIDSGDIVSFLEKTLSHIGLNPIESNDFITFWAPRMIMNKRCFIHFRINDNIRNTSFLEIEPKPESILRVFMEYTHQIPDWEIKEQSLPAFKRSGYSVIEWGGTELGSGVVH